ncbi:MAG: type III restriction endonuclease subunit R [Deltaproteobacteria bacterium]|jgi:hypothetical protein|nr:type III restriction endonuclease subunit R [Deltaproteobacteria bacterium]
MARFGGWDVVARSLERRAKIASARLNEGQRAALRAIAGRLQGAHGNHCRGVVIADEVGMGKTRVASAVASAVVAADGRVAILVPPGLGFQWQQELRGDGLHPRELVRSLLGYLRGFEETSRWSWDDVVLISHQVTNWRLGESSDVWRWALLPELVALHHKHTRDRLPHGYWAWSNGELARNNGELIRHVAKMIHEELCRVGRSDVVPKLDAWVERPWSTSFDDGGLYHAGGGRRSELEEVFGWGLGRFDLVVVDEAHKARGEVSGLSRLLKLVYVSNETARLGLTATPVALDVAEWDGTLKRVGVPAGARREIGEVGRRYADATARLRDTWRTSEINRETWTRTAEAFASALRPYVLRRDKREDPAVCRFRERAGPQEPYRVVRSEALHVRGLSEAWRRVVFAAEGLSATVHGGRDPVGKRLRLTLANGHGIASVIDATLATDAERQAEGDATLEEKGTPDAKQEARAHLWVKLIGSEVGRTPGDAGPDLSLYQHPQIHRAVELIEDRLELGEKVLVFGRYSRPMHALQNLLNARARLRSLCEKRGEPWPEETVEPGVLDWLAAQQLELSRDVVDAAFQAHGERYRAYELRRAWLRGNLLSLLERDLQESARPPEGARRRGLGVLGGLRRDVEQAGEHGMAGLVRAVWELAAPEVRGELLAERDSERARAGLAEAFLALVASAASVSDPEGDDGHDDTVVEEIGKAVRTLVAEEFGPRRGGLARLLDGSTSHGTRRVLQAAFNRGHSFPRVLIAQSIVGREGLNLHEACRVVLLLHPEWNPGVVEQQIGRVDRIGSRWEQLLERCLADDRPADELPRIEVLMPVFEGTYDEHQWRVLLSRWDDLRAQLHGVVVPPSEPGDDQDARALAESLNSRAPDFSPLRG